MSDEAHGHWAMVAVIALMTFLVVGCTASVAYWTGSSIGLLSLLVPLFMHIRMGDDQDAKQER